MGVIQAAITAACMAGGGTVIVPAGTTQECLTIPCSNITLDGQSTGAIIKCSSALVPALEIRNGTGAATITGVRVANLTIEGSGQYAVEAYHVTRSSFENLRIWGAKQAEFRGVQDITDAFTNISSVSVEFPGIPAAQSAMQFDNDGVSYYAGCGYCTFNNINATGLAGAAMTFSQSSGNVFYGGAIQASGTGLMLAKDAQYNSFTGIDFEVNTVADAIIYGPLNAFTNITTYSNGKNFEIAGYANRLTMGVFQGNILIDSSAYFTLLDGINIFGTFTDHGNHTRNMNQLPIQ